MPVRGAIALALTLSFLTGGCSPAETQDTAATSANSNGDLDRARPDRNPRGRIPRECGSVTIPELTASISDPGDILGAADEARLNTELTAYREATGHQAVIAILPTLNGKDDALVARCIGDSWAIGDATRQDGLLLLLAPNEQLVRVAMGSAFGEEEADAKAQLVITAMMPKLNQNDWSGGFSDGIVKMREVFP